MNWPAIKAVFQCSALLSVSYLSITAAIAVHTLEKHASATLMSVDDTVGKVNKTLDTVNGKDGTIAQVDKLLTDGRLTIAHADRTLTAQQASIASFDVEIQQSLENLNYVLHTTNDTEAALGAQAGTLLSATTETVKAAQPLLVNSDLEVQQLIRASEQINIMLPTVQQTLINTRDTTANVDAATADVKNFIHKETTPKKLGFWGSMEAGAIWAHKILMPSIF